MRPIRRMDRDAVSPVVAEILLVAIAVVLAAVLYIMAAGLLMAPGTERPLITFAPGGYPDTKGNMTLTIAGTSATALYAAFKFNLMVESVLGNATPVGSSGTPVSIVVGATTYKVTYVDFEGTGHVTAGDTFTIGGNGVPLPRNAHFTFYLIWTADGTVIQPASWQT